MDFLPVDQVGKFISDLRSAVFFEEDLDHLSDAMNALMHQRNQLEKRVESALKQSLVPREAVVQWLARVKSMESDVSDTLKQGSQILDRSCLCGVLPNNCWTSYRFGKRVMKHVALVENMMKQALGFDGLVDRSVPSRVEVQEFPTGSVVGLESTFVRVWSSLEEDGTGIAGLIGMGGVGKTTLLRNIYNKYREAGSGYDFVMLVVVSQEPNIARIQEYIGYRLRLLWSESEGTTSRSQDIFNVLRRKRFVLLFDDLWQRLDLLSIGIPIPDSKNKSKIVFTTRSEYVCAAMEADMKFRVECLGWKESWKLFQDVVGAETLKTFDHRPDITRLAESIVKECGGLPLFITIVGGAMAGKSAIDEWQYAIRTLEKSAGDFRGMEGGIFSCLKLGYDNLPDDTIRSCFLFCALYPGDFEIPTEPLIMQWIGEGYIHWFDDLKEAIDEGYRIIQILTRSFFFTKCGEENFCVKMHDIVRDFALWLSRGEGKHKDLVVTGSSVSVASKTDLWRKAQSVSLAHTEIHELDDVPKCPDLETLLLFESNFLTRINDCFFEHMPTLRFLDMSGTCIKRLPRSIGELGRLEFLDISFTRVRELPYETTKLIRLKYLFLEGLEGRDSLHSPELIGHLLNLQMIKLSDRFLGHERASGILELARLVKLAELRVLEIEVSNGMVLEGFLMEPLLMHCTRSFSIDGEPDGSDLDIIKLALSPTRSCLSLWYMKKLQKLRISNCQKMEELVLNSSAKDEELLECLETVILEKLPKLVVSWDIYNSSSFGFRSLRHIRIIKCDAMRNLTWLLLVPNLQSLFIRSCETLEEIISCEDRASDANTFLKLEVLFLEHLPCLSDICFTASPLSSLKSITVIECPKLRRLPLGTNSAHSNALEYIKGEADWWDNLLWKDETVKSALTPFFFPVL